jgi:hypothetical protein
MPVKTDTSNKLQVTSNKSENSSKLQAASGKPEEAAKPATENRELGTLWKLRTSWKLETGNWKLVSMIILIILN